MSALYWAVSVLACLASYWLGQRSSDARWKSVVDTLQYPPGCTCIKNSLGYGRNCPHHGHLA